MKKLKISDPRICGTVCVDEKDIIREAPKYWKKYIGKPFDSLMKDVDTKGKTEIHYSLTGESYDGKRIDTRTKYFKRSPEPQIGDRGSQDKPSPTDGEGGGATETVKERHRIILRRGSIQEGLGFDIFSGEDKHQNPS